VSNLFSSPILGASYSKLSSSEWIRRSWTVVLISGLVYTINVAPWCETSRHAYRRRIDVEDNTRINLIAAANTTMEINKCQY